MTIHRLDRFGGLGAGADDGLDELAVGVFIAAVDELGERLRSVGTLVVDPAEVQGGEREMRGTNDERRGEALARLRQCVSQRGGFERGEVLAGPPTNV